MTRPYVTPPRFRKHLLAVAASISLLPLSASALDLIEAPPGTIEPYVRPNVIISVDDSGSMGWRLNNNNSGTIRTQPNPDGTWPVSTERMSVLRYALRSIFDPTHAKYDSSLLPDGKIRLAWQIMHANGNATAERSVDSGSGSTGTPTLKVNSMRVLQGTHRNNFLSFVGNMRAQNGTPSHDMMRNADQYMRRDLGKNGPWSSDPGGSGPKSTEYLGCRRNYHIFMTDGRWNGTAHAVPNSNRRDNATNLTLPNDEIYGTSTPERPGLTAQTRLYRDSWNGSTIADWAFYSWATQLQSPANLEGSIKPAADYNKAPAEFNFGTEANPAKLLRFWDPRYNPADWPHMVTYTIGFSQDAITWPGASDITKPTETLPFGYDGSFPNLVRGTQTWPQMNNENKRSLDLWHAALNGRGRFFAVEKGEDLEKAFRDIFGQINAATDPDFASSATSGSNITRYDVTRYTAAYEPDNHWKGFVQAHTIKPNGDIGPAEGWNNKNTAELLDALPDVDDRLILSWSDHRSGSGAEAGGVEFRWANSQSYLSSEQKNWLRRNTAGTLETNETGENRLNYIRGDRNKEGVDPDGYTSAKPFRERNSRQGDIINSAVWFVGAPSASYAMKGYTAFTRDNKDRAPMIYVGGNDGMLHGFSAENGEEKIAYVPKGVIPKLRYLTSPEYDTYHKYFVDGSVMTGDVDLTFSQADPEDLDSHTPDWRTLLVGTLGLGGKGYYVLDVTHPGKKEDVASSDFIASNAGQLAVLDRTRSELEGERDCSALTGSAEWACEQDKTEEADIGHITMEPVVDDVDPLRSTQITLMNNNRWAVVMGNGYNSLNQRPVLLVQYLDGERELVRIQATSDDKGTGNAADNGLAAPRVVDLNGDGRVDVVYAGDNLGNMWKFDLTSINDANWSVAFGDNKPLFTARGPVSYGSSAREQIQPISAPPTVRANDRIAQEDENDLDTRYAVGGLMVAFGTGRNIAKGDPEANTVDSLYSVLDRTRYEVINTSLGKRLKVHPGAGTCSPVPQSDCVPAPQALGTGVTDAKLAKQKINEVNSGDGGQIEADQELDKLTWGGYNGWYLDLPSVGERLLKPISFYDGSNILSVFTQVPARGSRTGADPDVESCDTVNVDAERQWLTLINIMDGKRPSIQIIDYNNDGLYDENDDAIGRVEVPKGDVGLLTGGGGDYIKLIGSGGGGDSDADDRDGMLMARMPEESTRPSWRQIN